MNPQLNPRLSLLQPYPFEKLRRLFAGIEPVPGMRDIRLSIGEPQHPTPQLIKDAVTASLGGLASYPATLGSRDLREAIAGWIGRRYGIAAPDPESEVLPVNGSREALFAFAQTVIDGGRPNALVACPNPFYQIYEGAALLAGAQVALLDTVPDNDYAFDFEALAEETWRRVQLLYVCSPANPTGKVIDLAGWRQLFELSDRHDFVIASDECYSEIYFDEGRPPLGALEAAHKLGRGFRNLVVFSSLSKRSNVPGMRSGFVAGDAALLKPFLLYRTYHGSAMNPVVQAASAAAWNDEAHVVDNRRLYREKFAAITPMLTPYLKTRQPDAGFYLWAATPMADTDFARQLLARYNVSVLPGSYLARETGRAGTRHNPGAGFVRIALVAGIDECREAAERIADFCRSL